MNGSTASRSRGAAAARRCRRRLPARSERRDEPIAAARQRLDEPRVVRIVAERGAQALHRRVQAVLEVDEGAVRPQPLAQLLARDDVAGALEHQPEDLERLLLQADAGRARPQLAQPHVELERAERRGRVDPGFHEVATGDTPQSPTGSNTLFMPQPPAF